MTNNTTPEKTVTAPTLTKADLVESLSSRLGFDRQEARQMVDMFFGQITDALTSGATVKLPGLGNLTVRDKKSRPGRNLRTGEVVTIQERRVVVFHPSTLLTKRVSDNLISQGIIIQSGRASVAEDDEE